MRYEGYEDAYEKLKSLSRGNKIDESAYKLFISNLEISKSAKKKLLALTPAKYIGLSKKL